MKSLSTSQIESLVAENNRLKAILEKDSSLHGHWYKDLFENNTEATLVCETFTQFPSVIVDYNKEFKQIIKRSDEDLLGKEFLDLLQRGEKRKFFTQTLSHVDSQKKLEMPVVFLDGENNEIVMEITITSFTVKDKEFAIIKLQAINHKRTMLQNGIEQLLLHSQNLLLGISEDEILMFDYVSLSAFKTTGYAAEQLKLNPFLFWNNCHPEDFLKIKNTLKSKQRYSKDILVRFIRHDGKMIWLNFSITQSSDLFDKDTSFFMFGKEVTYQKRKHHLLQKKDDFKHSYNYLAKDLLSFNSPNELKPSINKIGKQLHGERFAIYFKGENDAFSHNYFSPNIDLEDQVDTCPIHRFQEEFLPELSALPLVVYHPDEDTFGLDKKHHHFIKTKKLESFVIAPLLVNDQCMGIVLCVNYHRTRDWDRSELNFIVEVSELFSAFFSNK